MNSLQKMISNTSTQNVSPTEKICPLCQKKFIPKGRQKYCDGPHFKPCPVCGKLVPAPYPSDPAKCCSSECRKKWKSMSSSAASVAPEIKKTESVIVEEPTKEEYPLDPEIKLNTDPLRVLEKGTKEFFIKECIFDSKIKGLIKGHVYTIEVTKDSYTYEVILSYDHTYREDINIIFNVASAVSFNTYFK